MVTQVSTLTVTNTDQANLIHEFQSAKLSLEESNNQHELKIQELTQSEQNLKAVISEYVTQSQNLKEQLEKITKVCILWIKSSLSIMPRSVLL